MTDLGKRRLLTYPLVAAFLAVTADIMQDGAAGRSALHMAGLPQTAETYRTGVDLARTVSTHMIHGMNHGYE